MLCLQVENCCMLKHSKRSARAWFKSSLVQCAASMGHQQALKAILLAPRSEPL